LYQLGRGLVAAAVGCIHRHASDPVHQEPVVSSASWQVINLIIIEDGRRVEDIAAVAPATVGDVVDAILVSALTVSPRLISGSDFGGDTSI
jgi:hypothetical protein